MNENTAPQPDPDEERPWYLRNPFFEHEAARVKALPLPEHEQHIIGEACSDLEQGSWFDPELLTIIERLASAVERLQQEKTTAVQDAVADVLRQVRQPVRDIDYSKGTETVCVNRGIRHQIRETNYAADALAKRYGVDLGSWPEAGPEF